MQNTEQSAKAFNLWMDEFTNDPAAFAICTETALQHMRERLAGKEPTYGDSVAATYAAYLERVAAD